MSLDKRCLEITDRTYGTDVVLRYVSKTKLRSKFVLTSEEYVCMMFKEAKVKSIIVPSIYHPRNSKSEWTNWNLTFNIWVMQARI